LGFQPKKSKKKEVPPKNPYANYGVPEKMDTGNFKGAARKRLLECSNAVKELKLLINQAYEIFERKQAKKLVRELHSLKDELFEKDGITRKDIKNLW